MPLRRDEPGSSRGQFVVNAFRYCRIQESEGTFEPLGRCQRGGRELPGLDVTAYVTEPPKFVIKDGLVHVSQRYSERMCIERVMPLHTFLRTIAAAQKAVREYEARGHAEVIAFPKKAS
jgi:hypothetical protein